jgi:hypothetical protein
MKMRTFCQLSVFLLLALGALLPLEPGVQAAAARPLLVIISSTVGLTDISSALLRRTFQGYPAEYKPGKRLIPLNYPNEAEERHRFDLIVLGLTADEVGRFWVDQRIRGSGSPPRTVPSAELAVRVVLSFAGAITYTTPELVKPGLTVLTIDGKAAGDPNYMLSRP